jgi:hypothetical protein
MEAAHVLRNNIVRVRGAAVPGWLETVLAGPLASIAIAVKAESLEQAGTLEVRLAWSANAWSPVYAEAAVAASVQSAEDGAILHFNAPPLPESMHAGWLGVLVSGPLSASVEGVWGLPGDASQSHSAWSALRAPAAGIAAGDDEPASTNVVVAIDAADTIAHFAAAGRI